MKTRKIFFRIVCIFLISNYCLSIRSQVLTLTIDTLADYLNRGWETLVVQNKYITVGIVPSMGGNILQYDFGADTLLLLNENTFGQNYEEGSGLSPFAGDWGFGGFQTWPTPELWPPPPNLTYRLYTYSVESFIPDSIVIFLGSQVETAIFPGLRMERRISVYKNSTRMRVENTLINSGPDPLTRGIMNVNYIGPEHMNNQDFDNFSIHFPLNPDSHYGPEGVYYNPRSTAFTGEIIPGIYSIDYQVSQGKIFADIIEGWGSFADKRDSQLYVRIFNIFEGEEYPDEGARFEVYISANPRFMAIEVMSPLKTLPAENGRYTFCDNLYATRLNANIRRATHAGATLERLTFDTINNLITGKFGVFSEGELQLYFYDIDHSLLDTGSRYPVFPDTAFILREDISPPQQTKFIELKAYDTNNEFIDILDFIDFTIPDIEKTENRDTELISFRVVSNLLQRNETLFWQVNDQSGRPIIVELYDCSGRKMDTLFSGIVPGGFHTNAYPMINIAPGLYLLVCRGNTGYNLLKIIVTE